MFCPQCGASNPDGSAICIQCGRNLLPAAVPMPVQGVVLPLGQTVPNYLIFAILSTVFCCLPAGIPAIIFAAQVNGKLQAGDLAGALAASRNARTWCWVSFGIGLGSILIWLLLMALGIVNNLAHHY
ncbi:MAG TPA: CD225/dispanin family protein [Candidatus Sulfotelmatobacter sp.]